MEYAKIYVEKEGDLGRDRHYFYMTGTVRY
jgi:hypothetical protein